MTAPPPPPSAAHPVMEACKAALEFLITCKHRAACLCADCEDARRALSALRAAMEGAENRYQSAWALNTALFKSEGEAKAASITGESRRVTVLPWPEEKR